MFMKNLKRIKIKGHKKPDVLCSFARSGTKWNDIGNKVISLC